MSMRTILLAGALAFLCGTAPTHEAAADQYLVHRHRNVAEFDAVYRALLAAVQANSDLSRDFGKSAKVLEQSGLTIDEDLKDADSSWRKAARLLRDVRYRDLVEVKAAGAAFVALQLALKTSMGFEIQAVEDRVNRFATVNPDKPVDGQRAGIAAARDLIAPVDAMTDPIEAYKAMRKALAKLKSVKTFPYVAKPPKKKCGPALAAGELAEGSWGLYDFDEKLVLPTFFRANFASVTVSGSPARVGISFGYCNGIDRDLVTVSCSAPAAVGTHTVTGGGLTQGFNSLCCSLAAGSTVTFTKVDLDNGVVEGTFFLRNSSNFAGGPGRFLLRIDPQ